MANLNKSLERNRFAVGDVAAREAAFRQFSAAMVAAIREKQINMDGLTREVLRVSSVDYHYYDAEALARLDRAVAVWVDLGGEEDTPGISAMVQRLLNRGRNANKVTVLAVRSKEAWANETKMKISMARDLAEVYGAA